MLRNHLFALMNAYPNHEVGVIVNGVLVPVDGVTERADPPCLALILDPDALSRSMKAQLPPEPAEVSES